MSLRIAIANDLFKNGYGHYEPRSPTTKSILCGMLLILPPNRIRKRLPECDPHMSPNMVSERAPSMLQEVRTYFQKMPQGLEKLCPEMAPDTRWPQTRCPNND